MTNHAEMIKHYFALKKFHYLTFNPRIVSRRQTKAIGRGVGQRNIKNGRIIALRDYLAE